MTREQFEFNEEYNYAGAVGCLKLVVMMVAIIITTVVYFFIR